MPKRYRKIDDVALEYEGEASTSVIDYSGCTLNETSALGDSISAGSFIPARNLIQLIESLSHMGLGILHLSFMSLDLVILIGH